MTWWTRLWRHWRVARPAPPPAEAPPVREHIPELHDLRGEATREQLRVGLLERDLTRARAARLARERAASYWERDAIRRERGKQ